jgi:tetratricopeptide (TPR) repeat protein
MKKIILLSVIFVLSLLLAACQPAIDEKKSDFCKDLGDFAQAQAQFRQLNETSTKNDVEEAASDLERSWERVKDSAGDVAEAQLNNVEDAWENLKRDINDIPNDATLAEAEAMIKADVLNTMAETVQIMTTTCTYGQEQ